MKVVHLNKENFEKEVLKADKVVLVDFFAEWCGPCKMMAPLVEKIAEEIGEKIKVCKLNVDEAQDIASKYEIMSIPTFIVFKKGEPVKRTVGIQSEEKLKEIINI